VRLLLAPIGLHGAFDEMTVHPRPASPGRSTNVDFLIVEQTNF